MKIGRRAFLQMLFAVVIIISGVGLSRLPIEYASLARFGYAGVFLVALVGSATVFLPGPTLPVILAAGMTLNPVGVAIAGGFGSAIGEFIGYFAGNQGKAGIKDWKRYKQIEGWVKRYGVVAIFILAAIPNPLFDLAGLAAGASGLSLIKFLIPTLLGRLIRSFYVAYIGAYVGRQ